MLGFKTYGTYGSKFRTPRIRCLIDYTIVVPWSLGALDFDSYLFSRIHLGWNVRDMGSLSWTLTFDSQQGNLFGLPNYYVFMLIYVNVIYCNSHIFFEWHLIYEINQNYEVQYVSLSRTEKAFPAQVRVSPDSKTMSDEMSGCLSDRKNK